MPYTDINYNYTKTLIEVGPNDDPVAGYATAHDAVSATEIWDDMYVGQKYLFDVITGHWNWAIRRSCYSFDTSILSGKTIISVQAFFGRSGSPTEEQYIHIVQGDFAVPVLATDYFSLLFDTEPRGTAYFSIGNNYATCYLNAIGISEINTSGTTKFALRSKDDVDDDPMVYDLNATSFSRKIGEIYSPSLRVYYESPVGKGFVEII